MRVLVGEAVPEMLVRSLAPVVRCIGAALGPDGRTVLVPCGDRVAPALTGVEIARAVVDARGAATVAPTMLKETLVAADRDLGDGTARLALIAATTFRAAVRRTAGRLAATGFADEMDDLRGRVAAHLDEQREEAPDPLRLALAAGADPHLAEALTALFGSVGPEGVIDIAESPRAGIEVSSQPGFCFDAVHLPAGSSGEKSVLSDVHVLAADDIVSDFGALAPVLEGFARRGKSLLVVARDVVGPALAAIERNRAAGLASVVALRPTDVSARAAGVIGDLAAATGATLLGGADGSTVAGARPGHLGRAEGFRLAHGTALLDRPRHDPDALRIRAAEIGHDIRQSRYLALDREHAERRLARLTGRWARLDIGPAEGADARARAMAARRALACLRAAATGGAVEGAGRSLARVADGLERRPSGGAAGAVAEGLRSVADRLARNAASGDRAPPAGNSGAVFDPLPVSRGIAERALSLAAGLMRVEAVVCR